jgi:hypothetical protein
MNDAVLMDASDVNTVVMKRDGSVQVFGSTILGVMTSRTRTSTPIISQTPSNTRVTITITPSNTKTITPTITLTRSIIPTRTR